MVHIFLLKHRVLVNRIPLKYAVLEQKYNLGVLSIIHIIAY